MKLETLNDLFHHEIKDLYSAETQIIDALPKMIDATSDEKLRTALEEHLEVTKKQKQRLEGICDDENCDPSGHECKGMKGLIEEGEELLEEDASPDVLDAGIIAAAQRIEHYEIAGYGSARTYARKLGKDDAAKKLQATLDEESEADERLTKVAESRVNVKAKAGAS